MGIIIPCYNSEKYLEEAIISVLSQPCKDLLVIIVNDGSKDSSESIASNLAKMDNRIIILNQSNKGVSVARNLGIEYCIKRNIEYIAFLDSDDIWMKSFYTEDLKSSMGKEIKDAYKFNFYDGNEKLTRGKVHQVEDSLENKGRIERFGGHFCRYIYKADIFEKYNIRFPEGMKVQEDVVFRYVFFTIARSVKCYNRDIFVYRSNSLSVLHEKEYDVESRYFNFIIPAWEWTIKELERIRKEGFQDIHNRDIAGCYTMQKTYLSEYIEYACRKGNDLNRIKSMARQSKYSYLFDDEANIWVDCKSKKRWDLFEKYPTYYWLKCRIKEVFFQKIRMLRGFWIVQNKRYPEKL